MVAPKNPIPQVILGQFRFVLVVLLLTFLTVDGRVVMAEGWRWKSERLRRLAVSVLVGGYACAALSEAKPEAKLLVQRPLVFKISRSPDFQGKGCPDFQNSRFPE